MRFDLPCFSSFFFAITEASGFSVTTSPWNHNPQTSSPATESHTPLEDQVFCSPVEESQLRGCVEEVKAFKRATSTPDMATVSGISLQALEVTRIRSEIMAERSPLRGSLPTFPTRWSFRRDCVISKGSVCFAIAPGACHGDVIISAFRSK